MIGRAVENQEDILPGKPSRQDIEKALEAGDDPGPAASGVDEAAGPADSARRPDVAGRHVRLMLPQRPNQPLSAIVSNASAGLRWLTRPQPNFKEVEPALNIAPTLADRADLTILRILAIAEEVEPDRRSKDSAFRESHS
jgi:hypothetical protein